MSELKIKYINPNLLKPYPNNPRTIGEDEMEGLKVSLSKFGFAEPLAINKKNEVIGGNQRRLAAIELGIKEVPTTLIVLPTKEERALNVELNNKHIAGDWTPALAELLGQIKTDMPETYEALRLEPLELDVPEIDTGHGDGQDRTDDLPEPAAEPIIQAGDLVVLGKHRLLCGNSTKKECRDRLISDNKVDMVFSDPPYGINIVKVGGGGKTKFGTVGGGKMVPPNRYAPIIGDDKDFKPEYLLDYGESQIIWGGNHFANKMPNTRCWIVWDKKPDGARRNNFADCEIAWTSYDAPARIYNCIWQGLLKEGEQGVKRQHPTQKPIKLFVDILNDYSKEKNTIIDFYIGSGSTLIACEQLNRICYGMEIAPEYVQVSIERWINYTKKPEEVTIERDGKQYKWGELNAE